MNEEECDPRCLVGIDAADYSDTDYSVEQHWHVRPDGYYLVRQKIIKNEAKK